MMRSCPKHLAIFQGQTWRHSSAVLYRACGVVERCVTARAIHKERVIQFLVEGATEALRVIGVGSSPPDSRIPQGGSTQIPKEGDVAAVIQAIRSDYVDRAYFITGVLSDGIYDDNCYFADPTISFTGRELWKRNLQLLIPFLLHPSIDLLGLEQIPSGGEGEGRGSVIRAQWILKTWLRLPWRPFIEVEGETEYELGMPGNNQVIRHVESWNISGLEALLLIFTPGSRSSVK